MAQLDIITNKLLGTTVQVRVKRREVGIGAIAHGTDIAGSMRVSLPVLARPDVRDSW